MSDLRFGIKEHLDSLSHRPCYGKVAFSGMFLQPLEFLIRKPHHDIIFPWFIRLRSSSSGQDHTSLSTYSYCTFSLLKNQQ